MSWHNHVEAKSETCSRIAIANVKNFTDVKPIRLKWANLQKGHDMHSI